MPDPIDRLLDFGLCCPRCRGGLAPDVRDGEGTLHCGACAADFPVLLGIPDLRLFPDPYIGMEADRAKGRRLLEAGAAPWEELVRRYYAMTDTVTAAQAALFAGGLHGARARAEAARAAWRELDPPAAAPARLLDIGCGTAPLLAVVAGQTEAVGVDIAFRWLVVGRQRLRDAGVEAPLVCACAEALPFRDARFDLVAAQGTLENVRDQRRSLAEAHRVLSGGGRLQLTAANRFSLGPDPHLGIPAGGFLPEAAVAAVARRRGALRPERQLLSLRQLAVLLRHAGFADRRYGTPGLPDGQRETLGAVLRAAARLYRLLRRVPGARLALLLVGPTLVASARKPATDAA